MATDPADIILALQAIESRLDSRFDNIDKKFDSVYEKIEKAEDKFDRIDTRIDARLDEITKAANVQSGVLVGQAASLVQHMHRTDLLERALAETDNRVTPLQKQVLVATITVRVAAAFGAISAAVLGGPKALEYLKVLISLLGL